MSTTELERRPHDGLVVAIGLVVLSISTLFALSDTLSRAEVDLFRFVNRWPDWIEAPFWIVMQAGSFVAIPVSAIVALAVGRNGRLAAARLVAGAAAWLAAKLVKEVVERGRPAAFLDDVIERPAWEGLGFMSGHAAVAFALATVAIPYLRGWWRWLPTAIAVGTAILRVYTGAHLPLDVVGGAALGVAIGAAVTLAFGVPAAQPVDELRRVSA
ncbi:MAG: phosphatase PAP2 family protein [Ilumatobacteraceae bacterium]